MIGFGGVEIGRIYATVGADLSDFDRGMAEAALTMRATADSMGSSGDRIGTDVERSGSRFVRAFESIGSTVENATTSFSGWLSEAGQGGGILSSLGTAAGAAAPLLGSLAIGGAAVGAALLVLPALAGAATFALVALLDVVTTLSAVVAAFVAPLSLVAGMLGLLGGGFVLAGQKAMKGQGVFKEFGGEVSRLGGMFDHLLTLLGQDFMPIFEQMVGAAQVAITYFDRLAKMDSLNAVFKSLATDGVALLSKALYAMGNVLAHPFKLAVKLAFGGAGSDMQSAVHSWWTSFTNYLFGYSKTQQIHIGFGRMLVDQKNVRGALQPIINWFNRQDFTKTGLRWSNEIIDGFLKSPGAARLGQWASQIATHAGHMAGRAFRASLMIEFDALPGLIKSQVFDLITTNMFTSTAAQSRFIIDHLGQAWEAVKTKAISIWDSIVSYIESHIPHPTVNIGLHMPSLPHIPGLPSLPFGATGGIVNRPTVAMIGEAGPEAVVPLSQTRGNRPLPAGGSSNWGGSRARGHQVTLTMTDNELHRLMRAMGRKQARMA